MCAVVDESGYVVFRHFRQLFLENAFQTCENDHRTWFVIVVYDLERNIAKTLLSDGWLLRKGYCGFEIMLRWLVDVGFGSFLNLLRLFGVR